MRILLFALRSLVLFCTACPLVSQDVKTARSLASAPLSLKAAKDVVAVARVSGDVSPELANRVNDVSDKIEAIVEQVESDVRAGKFDATTKAKWDMLIANTLQEAQALIPLIKQGIDPRIGEWINVAIYTLPLLKSVIDEIKPPAPPASPTINADAKRKEENNASLLPGDVSKIIAFSTNAAIRLVATHRDKSIDSLRARFAMYKAEYHAGVPSAPSVKGKKAKK